ncbi:MAG: enoyl-CoA hydratase/isomerase family protein, partial [Enhydrobacter sp.]
MTAAPNEPVLLRRDDGPVAILTLNRPHAMNALSGDLIDALLAEFDRLGTDTSVRCVIVEAVGRAFSTGHDLREVASSLDRAVHHHLLERCSA